MKVNLGDQIYQWRQQLDDFGTANPQKKLMCKGMGMIYGSEGLYNLGTALAHWANIIPSPLISARPVRRRIRCISSSWTMGAASG